MEIVLLVFHMIYNICKFALMLLVALSPKMVTNTNTWSPSGALCSQMGRKTVGRKVISLSGEDDAHQHPPSIFEW